MNTTILVFYEEQDLEVRDSHMIKLMANNCKKWISLRIYKPSLISFFFFYYVFYIFWADTSLYLILFFLLSLYYSMFLVLSRRRPEQRVWHMKRVTNFKYQGIKWIYCHFLRLSKKSFPIVLPWPVGFIVGKCMYSFTDRKIYFNKRYLANGCFERTCLRDGFTSRLVI